MPLVSQPLNPGRPHPMKKYVKKTFKTFRFYPHLWQIHVVDPILKHDQDMISIAAMGSGKTLTFWMPLLLHKGGVQMVVTPLNLLGTVNVDDLVSKGFTVIVISAENATKKNFKVNPLLHSIRKQKIHYISLGYLVREV